VITKTDKKVDVKADSEGGSASTTPDVPEPVMPRVGGKPFRCEGCGANVFTRLNDAKLQCNGCSETYTVVTQLAPIASSPAPAPDAGEGAQYVVTYFKQSGKYYTEESVEWPKGTLGIHVPLSSVHRIKDMHAVCIDSPFGFPQFSPSPERDAAHRAEVDAAREEGLAWDDEDEEKLPEHDAIGRAFPTISGRHNLYEEAMRLIRHRRSKGSLVALVNWLLHREEAARAEAYERAVSDAQATIRRMRDKREHAGSRRTIQLSRGVAAVFLDAEEVLYVIRALKGAAK
jgi:hypothetical protein